MARGKAAEKGAILKRQLDALDLRKRGFTYREIAARLGISHQQAHKDVNSELQRLVQLNQDSATELRQLELERLDEMWRALEPMIRVGKTDSINSGLKVMERRAKLLGLDAPSELKVTDWRDEIIMLLRTGKVTPDQVRAELGNGLAEELFITAGVPIAAD